jgi:hypothetical protein
MYQFLTEPRAEDIAVAGDLLDLSLCAIYISSPDITKVTHYNICRLRMPPFEPPAFLKKKKKRL